MLLALAVPVLAAKCLSCHDGEAKTAGLDLATREAALRGGSSGKAAVVPGDASASRLYQYVKSGKMPPGKPLDEAEIREIEQWIASGAAWPEGKLTAARPRAGLDWWALQTPRKADPPQIDGAAHPVDAFLRAKLREKGLEPSPRSDARSLIRRLHLSLTGVPPKPSEMSEPYAAAMERLLASPHHAERLARYWLDVVRFGESDGGEHNHERMTAWKYRDYVIEAFHANKPFDQFAREQIAGDALAPGDPKLTAATGFLVAGPWDSVTKQINRDPLFRKTGRQDELDDMVTTTFATFQGLTVNCARCHDHKFDPIPTRDYYRLTAAFRGVTFGERDVSTPQQRKDRDAVLGPLRKEMARHKKELGEIEDAVRASLLREKLEAQERGRGVGAKHVQLNAVYNRNVFTPARSAKFRMVITSNTGNTPPRIDKLELLPAGKIIADWKGTKAAEDDAPQTLDIALDAPAEVSEIRWSTDAARGAKDGSPRVYRFEHQLSDGSWRVAGQMLDHEVPAEVALPEVSDSEIDAKLASATRTRRAELMALVKDTQARIDAVPPLDMVHAAKLESEMLPAHILERGSVSAPKEEVTPGTLSAIRQLAADLPTGSDSERRIALAKWITGKTNPLTARVIVNRVWQFHFGAGLVNTPSDFGFNGDRPSHPELLDWLAVSLMEHDWDLRWLERLILTSAAYQQSSRMNQLAHSVDADNRLLWRMSPRRMDAETLRDSILAVAGTLNLERGGPSFLLQKKEARGSYLYKALDNDGPPVWRRAVYRFIARGGERVFMDSFDCPDPAVATPQRPVSNTPVQALTLLNNAFVNRQAGLLAKRLESEAPSRDARVKLAHQLVLGRDPAAGEMKSAARFLANNGLDLYCLALLNSNEFVHVP